MGMSMGVYLFMAILLLFEKFRAFLNGFSNGSIAATGFDTKEIRYAIIGDINADICDKKLPTITPLTPLLLSPLRECS